MSGEAYDAFMGRYSRALAAPFAEWVGVARVDGDAPYALDLGCGPGALTGELVTRLGADHVVAVDPSPTFVSACAERFPGVVAQLGSAEQVPLDAGSVDLVLSQLVMHFVSDPDAMIAETRRVTRPGGVVAACVWDATAGMRMLRAYWDATAALDAEPPDEADTFRFGGPGEIAALYSGAGFTDVAESTLTVSAHYTSYDELWGGFLAGIGPAGAHCLTLSDTDRDVVLRGVRERVDSPPGGFDLTATARCVRATVH